MAAVSEFFGSQLQRLPLLHGGHFEAVTRQLLRPFGPSAVPPSSATSLQPPQCSNFGADWARLPLIFIIVIVVFISEFSGSSLQLLRCRYFSGCAPMQWLCSHAVVCRAGSCWAQLRLRLCPRLCLRRQLLRCSHFGAASSMQSSAFSGSSRQLLRCRYLRAATSRQCSALSRA